MKIISEADSRISLFARAHYIRFAAGRLQGHRRGSTVVECLTWYQGTMGLSLTGIIAWCPWARHISPGLVLVKPWKTHPYKTEILLMGHKETNQTNQVHRIAFSDFWNFVLVRIIKDFAELKVHLIHRKGVPLHNTEFILWGEEAGLVAVKRCIWREKNSTINCSCFLQIPVSPGI